jgi:hypothetical protein
LTILLVNRRSKLNLFTEKNFVSDEVKYLVKKRVVGRYSDEKVKEAYYFTLFRPHLEYTVSMWDPGHKDLIRSALRKKSLRADTECHTANTRIRLETILDPDAARHT